MEKIIKNSIPALQEEIRKEIGLNVELSVEFDGFNIRISSGSLISELGDTVVKTLFADIAIHISGEYFPEQTIAGFNSNLRYIHPNGGHNGSTFIWRGLWLTKDGWVFGDKVF
jgi:hypothetical protein